MIINKVCFCYMDSEFFYNEIHQEYTNWTVDYYDLKENLPKVEEKLQEDYPRELQALKLNEIDYIILERDD